MSIRERISTFFEFGARNTGHIGASRTSRAQIMNGKSYGPNTVAINDQTLLQNRSRDGVRNFPYPKNAIRKLVSHEIGSGIKPKFKTGDEKIDAQLSELWEYSHREIVNGNDGNFYAGQRLCSRARNEAGEVFIRRRRRSPSNSDLTVPMQVDILESDYLDITDNRTLSNGNKVRSGIEFNRSGKRVAYHFYVEHPSESSLFGQGSGSGTRKVRILAKDVIHHYIPLRPGQLRGLPINSASLFKSANLEKYDDFELVRKQNQSSFSGTVEREARCLEDGRLADPLTGQPYAEPEGEEPPKLKVGAGQFIHLGDGEKLNLFNGDKGGEFYADYMRQALLSISADYGVMYELVTGDWKNTTDRLYRAAMDDFKREIEAIQELYMISQVCQKVEAWWMDAIVLAGAVALPDYAENRRRYICNDWIPQGWPYMHPLQDAQAAEKLINNNTTHSREGRKHSVDTDRALVENVAHRKKKQDLEAAAGLSVEDEKDDKESDS